jgi:hypothetical protein
MISVRTTALVCGVTVAVTIAAAFWTRASAGMGTTYQIYGCTVYRPNDWFTTNLITGRSRYVSTTVDPNSAKMIANFIRAYGNVKLSINASDRSVHLNTPANVAAKTTPLRVVQHLNYGFADTPWRDASDKKIPWDDAFHAQGSCPVIGQDCHAIVLTPRSGGPPGTKPCIDYETYDSNDGPLHDGVYSAESLTVHNLNRPYNEQWSRQPGPTKSGLPLVGTTDLGEDAALPAINHIVALVIPGTDSSADAGDCSKESCAAGGYVAPASSGSECVAYCEYKIPFGARLRLRTSYACPSRATHPQANKLCAQLKTYGMILTDHGSPAGTFGFGLAPRADGTNPWNADDVSAISATSGGGIPLREFDIMTLGTLHS